MKRVLKELNKKHFAHISSKAEAARVELKQKQLELHDSLNDPILKEEVRSLQTRAAFLCHSERQFLAQKTKCDFLMEGDMSTKLFHSLVKWNAKRNYIASLTREDGTTTTSTQEVRDELLLFYGNLMGTWHDISGFQDEVMYMGPKISDYMQHLWFRVSR